MANYSSVLNDLHSVKDRVRIVKDTCLDTKPSTVFQIVVFELNGLANIISDVRMEIFRPQFRTGSNHTAHIAHLDTITRDLLHRLAVFSSTILQVFLQTRQLEGHKRADKNVDTRKVDDFKSNFARSCKLYRRVLDSINGREDWSNMVPKNPSAGLSAPKMTRSSSERSMLPPQRPASLNLSAPSPKQQSISMPPSPFQPMIEDVEDNPEEEPQDVQSYHMDPVPAEANAKGKQPVQPTPPQVFVRAPTGMTEDMIVDVPEYAEEVAKMAPKSILKKTSASSAGSSPSSRSKNGSSPKGELVQQHGADTSYSSIQDQVKSLEAELNGLQVSPNASPRTILRAPRQRENRLSVDFGRGTGLMEPPKQGRKRAATTTSSGPERPSAHRTESESSASSKRRAPRPSPRETNMDYGGYSYSSGGASHTSPQSSGRPYPSPRLPQSPNEQQGFQSSYQPSPLLPTVHELGQGQETTSSRRTPRPSPRFSQTFDEFYAVNAGQGANEDFELFGGGSGQEDMYASLQRRPSSSVRQSQLQHDDSWTPVLEHKLAVSLDDMYNGTTLKATINRKVMDAAGLRYLQENHSVSIPITRGLKGGSILKFKGAGDVTPMGSQDIHFVIDEAPHKHFTRRDNDLNMVLEIPLLESLMGWERTITTICGKRLTIRNKGPTPPDWSHALQGYGMINRRDTAIRGDLFVGVVIKYPTAISERQRRLVMEAFGER